MQTAFIARLVVKADKIADFEAMQKELSDITHDTEPDTLVYDFLKHRDAPNTYVVYSRFKDDVAFQVHQDAPDHERLVSPILDALSEEMDLQFFDLVE